MKCLRCNNEDPTYFYKGSKGYYCRKCIRFSRVLLEEELKSFDYFSNDDDGIWEFGNMENLKTLFIYPETGYELTGGGETFIKKVQYMNPKLQVNAPGAAGTENLVAVTEIETPSITDEQAAELLAQILEEDVDKVYEECDK